MAEGQLGSKKISESEPGKSSRLSPCSSCHSFSLHTDSVSSVFAHEPSLIPRAELMIVQVSWGYTVQSNVLLWVLIPNCKGYSFGLPSLGQLANLLEIGYVAGDQGYIQPNGAGATLSKFGNPIKRVVMSWADTSKQNVSPNMHQLKGLIIKTSLRCILSYLYQIFNALLICQTLRINTDEL